MAFFVMFVMCSLKLSLLSRMTPRNLADLDFGQFDGGVTHFNGSHCQFPVPVEHDNLNCIHV